MDTVCWIAYRTCRARARRSTIRRLKSRVGLLFLLYHLQQFRVGALQQRIRLDQVRADLLRLSLKMFLSRLQR